MSNSRKFEVEFLKDMAVGGRNSVDGSLGGDVLVNEAVDELRWAINYDLVFQASDDEKFYRTDYNRGTGDSGERPFEYQRGEIECFEVVPVTKVVTITEYVPA